MGIQQDFYGNWYFLSQTSLIFLSKEQMIILLVMVSSVSIVVLAVWGVRVVMAFR